MGRIAHNAAERRLLRQPGGIMLVSCYELGHQPLGIAQPIRFLEQAGFAPLGFDIAVNRSDESAFRSTRFVERGEMRGRDEPSTASFDHPVERSRHK